MCRDMFCMSPDLHEMFLKHLFILLTFEVSGREDNGSVRTDGIHHRVSTAPSMPDWKAHTSKDSTIIRALVD
jgi:hypothetical protein